MKKIFLFVVFLSSLNIHVCAQWTSAHPGMEWRAKGTGRTTGHVIDIWATNTGKEPVAVNLPSFYIPSHNKYQGYIIPMPADPTIMVDPGETVVIPLSGYCTDIHKPAVGDGENTIPIDEWITPDMTGPGPKPGDELDETVFEPVTTEESEDDEVVEYKPIGHGRTTGHVISYTTTYPGTEEPFGHTIDITEHADEAAPILFETIDLIHDAYEDLYNDGKISTPFSGNPEKERSSVIQQTFWIFTSLLSGDEYTVEDFSYKMKDQYKTATGKELEEADSTVQTQFQTGVEDFWSTFELVGVEAKVLIAEERDEPELFEPEGGFEDETITDDPGKCVCSKCIIDPEASFQKYKNIDGRESYTQVTNDSITWNYNLKYHPPGIRSDCPKGCKEHIDKKFISEFIRDGYQNMTSTWTEGPQIRESFSGPGKIIYSAKFWVTCDDVECCVDTVTDTLYIVESNDCCDRLRDTQGKVTFDMGNGKSIQFDQNSLYYNKNGRSIRYDFPINIEAAFCNLENGETYGEVNQELTGSYASGGTISESQASSSLSLQRPHEADLQAQGIEPHYHFRFMLSENGQETQFALSMDKETCKFDISVLHNGQIEEFTSGSIYTTTQLLAQINALNAQPLSQYWWARMQYLYLQMMKMEDASSRNRCEDSLNEHLLGAINEFLDLKNRGWNVINSSEERLLNQLKNAINSGDNVQVVSILMSGNLPVF